MTGRSAWLFLIPQTEELGVNPRLQTPLLTADIAAHHYENGLTPVVLYPETIHGNPLTAPVRVRWFGNYPGLLGGSTSFDHDEICFAHSRHLARVVGPSANVLCIPTVDTALFRPAPGATRKGTCFYAQKFQVVHNQTVFGLPVDCVEITRFEPASRAALAALFQRSEAFYCFEDSALINEAALCGCPVVMMRNSFFPWPLGIEEMGWDGYAWGDDPAEFARAVRTVDRAFDNYIKNIPVFFSQLQTFTSITQKRARAVPYCAPVRLPGLEQRSSEILHLRRALAEARLENVRHRAGSGDDGVLWNPKASLADPVAKATFLSGWHLEVAGARSEDACSLVVYPDAASAITLLVVSDRSAREEEFEFLYDLDLVQRVSLAPDEERGITLPVIEPGKPILVNIRSCRPAGGGLLLLKSIQRERGATFPSPSRDGADALRHGRAGKPHGNTHEIVLENGLGGRLQGVNCELDVSERGLLVRAAISDPQLLIPLDEYAELTPYDLYLWGECEVAGDEMMTIYVPTAPLGALNEVASRHIRLKAGVNVFVGKLPHSGASGPVRIDPLEKAGVVRFTRLRLVLVRDGEALTLPRPVSHQPPMLARFSQQSLLWSDATVLNEDCSIAYVHNALEVRTSGIEAHVLFYLGEPALAAEGCSFTALIEYETTLPGDIAITLPDLDGSYAGAGARLRAEVFKGHHSVELYLSPFYPIQSLRLSVRQLDVLRLLVFKLIVLRPSVDG